MIRPTEKQHTSSLLTEEERARVAGKAVPRHVAIIMDGNRRWAKRRGGTLRFGHSRGAEALDGVVRTAVALGIGILTVYALSTENLRRPAVEIDALMHILERYLLLKKEMMIRNGIRLTMIGDPLLLPERVRNRVHEAESVTRGGTTMELVLALGYGGRDEIRRALIRLIREVRISRCNPEEITEEMIGRYLDTAGRPDPDLLIRTGGATRISNFLIWQISYTEIHCSDVLWPDFSKEHLLEAIAVFQGRERRFGS